MSSRLNRVSAKNTHPSTNQAPAPAPLPPSQNDHSTLPSTTITSSRPSTRTRTLSTQSTHQTRPPSRLHPAQPSLPISSNTRTSSIPRQRKPSSPPKLTIHHPEPRRKNDPSENQDQPQSSSHHQTQHHLPGANIKVVVRCRHLSDSERAIDPQLVLLTGGVRGRELTVDLNHYPANNNPPLSSNHYPQPSSSQIHQQQPNLHDIPSNREEGTGLSNTDYSSSLVDDPKRSANIKVYPFDHVFGPEADQALIFADVVSPILTEVLQGYNCTIFAYGQTGTGKTYTMTGDLSIPTATTIMPTTKTDSCSASPSAGTFDPTPLVIPTSLRKFTNEAGIIPRVLHSLFNMLEDCSEEEKVEFGVKVSFVELYNEELRDLNYPESSNNPEANPPPGSMNLKIFDDANPKKGTAGGSGVYIQNLTETSISSAKEGIKILTLGSSRRQIAATKCNEQSSRSHSVFSITIHVKESNKDGKEDQFKIGKLNLVDLAGSENVGRSGAGKEFGRAREAGMINQSLLTLGRVINALVEKSSHVPYRESKLTRLLQDSLGGKTKTCIIATVSPSRLNLEETISTLDYALRAKSIKNRPELNNRINKSVLINQYIQEIEKLRHDLIASRTKNGIYFTEERWGELIQESESKNRTLIEAKRKIELIELESIGVKKEFEKCLRILNVRESEVKKIQDELSKKSNDLDQSNLLNLNLESRLSHETQLREKLEASRAKWKKQCQEAFEDNEGLRAKIARKAEVESFNQNTLNDVDQSLSTRTINLKNDLKEFGSQSNQINKGIKIFLNELEQRLVQGMKKNQNLVNQKIEMDLKRIIKSISESILEIKSKLNEGFLDQIRNHLIPNDLLNQNRNHLNLIVQKFEIEKFSGIQSIFNQLKDDTCKLLENTKDSLQSCFQIIHQKLTQDRTKMIKYHELEKTELKEEASKLKEDIELLRQNMLEDEKRVQDDEKELIELIQRQHVSNLKRKKSQTDLLVKSLNELKDRKDKKRLKFTNFEKEFDDSRNQFDLQVNGTLGLANENLETFESTFQESQSNIIDHLMIDQRERINLHTLYSNKMENLAHSLDQKCEKFIQGFEIFDQDLKTEVFKIQNQIIDLHHQKLKSQTQNQIQTIEGSVKQVLNDVERQSMISNDCIDKTMNSIGKLSEEVHIYLTNEIRKDIKTGQTPRRRKKKLMIKLNNALRRNGSEGTNNNNNRSIQRRSIRYQPNSDDELQEEAEVEEDDDESDDDLVNSNQLQGCSNKFIESDHPVKEKTKSKMNEFETYHDYEEEVKAEDPRNSMKKGEEEEVEIDGDDDDDDDDDGKNHLEELDQKSTEDAGSSAEIEKAKDSKSEIDQNNNSDSNFNKKRKRLEDLKSSINNGNSDSNLKSKSSHSNSNKRILRQKSSNLHQ